MRTKKSRSQIGKRNRANGKTWERQVASDLRAVFGAQVRRGWQSRQGADEPDVTGIPHLWVECKNVRNFNIEKTLEQCFRDIARSGRDYWSILIAVKQPDRKVAGTNKQRRLLFLIDLPGRALEKIDSEHSVALNYLDVDRSNQILEYLTPMKLSEFRGKKLDYLCSGLLVSPFLSQHYTDDDYSVIVGAYDEAQHVVFNVFLHRLVYERFGSDPDALSLMDGMVSMGADWGVVLQELWSRYEA